LFDGVDVVCYQVVMVGVGVIVVDFFLYVGYNDFGMVVLFVVMYDCGVGLFVFVSLMVVYGEGCYVCVDYGE